MRIIPDHDCGWADALEALTIPGTVKYRYRCPECGRRFKVEGTVHRDGTHRGRATPVRRPKRAWVKRMLS